MTSNHSLDSGRDAAADRRLRLAQRRRQREEGGHSETSSDNSKEPSVERASSLRRDSDSDSVGTLGSSLSRRRAGRRPRESGLAEESEGKESSPDVGESSSRRSRRLRSATGSSEESTQSPSLAATTLDSASVSEARASHWRRRQQEAAETSESRATGHEALPTSHVVTSVGQDSSEADRSSQLDSETRRTRRQQRLEAGGRQVSGSQDERGDRNESSTSSTTTRSWRQRLQEQGVSGVSHSEADDAPSRRRRSQGEERTLVQCEAGTRSGRQSQDAQQEAVSRRRSLRGLADGGADEIAKVADAVATEVETRAERIARYKEERRKQLAHIASITSTSGSDDKETDALPSLFISAKREKEDSPCETGRQTVSAAEASESGGALTLMSRLRALRRGSHELIRESDTPVLATVPETVKAQDAAAGKEFGLSMDTKVKTRSAEHDTVESRNTSSVRLSPDHSVPSAREKFSSSTRSSQSSTLPSQASTTTKTSSSESSRLLKSPSPASVRKPLTSTGTGTAAASTTTTSSARRPSASSREPSPKKVSSSSSEAKSERQQTDSSTEARKSKSPSPVTSRLMAATRSSAAKGIQSTVSRSSPSPRSSPSRRGDKHAATKPSDAATSLKGPPKIKQTLMPERETKETVASRAGKSAESEGRIEETSSAQQPGSKYLVRLPLSQQSKGDKATGAADKLSDRESPKRSTRNGTNSPKLSSSSFSTASTSRSTDRDSGFGSSRLSSSSFSATRSPEKEMVDTKGPSSSKTHRLQRSVRVEVSSSSSREGSEEKQLPAPSGRKLNVPTSKAVSSVKRTSSLPARTVPSDELPAKISGVSSIRESPRSQPRGSKFSSSSPVEESSPPKDSPLSQKSGVSRQSSREDERSRDASRTRRSQSETTALTVGIPGESTSTTPSCSPLSPPGTVGLDDILAKNAEFLSSDEEVAGGRQWKQRKLQAEEEPRLRRSVRRRLLHKSGSSGSSSKDDVGSSGR